MKENAYLRSRQRRGRWFHYYRRDGQEVSLGVHGLHPTDPRVFTAYCAMHADYEHRKKGEEAATPHTLKWAVNMLKASRIWESWKPSTQQNRAAILKRYTDAQGDRPLSSITKPDIEAALYAVGGWAAVNELKALRPVFKHAKKMRHIAVDPTEGIELEKPKTKGHPTATPLEITNYRKRWPLGTTERLVFDLALYTGAARVDLCKLGRKHIQGDVLTFTRQKSGVEAFVPITSDLRAVIATTPDISPAFLLTKYGKPFTEAGLGNFFNEAATEAKIKARLHGLRKAFCVYWAEQGKSTHEIAAMAGHSSLAEVERYTRAADRRAMIRAIAGASKMGHA